MSLLDCMETIREIGMQPGEEGILIGGGAKGALWRQITADMLGITLKTTASSDSSLGAAMLAGVAMGIFADYEEAAGKCVKITGRTKPNPENTEFYRQQYRKYKQIHDALAQVYHNDYSVERPDPTCACTVVGERT